jgi:hypothetical protein
MQWSLKQLLLRIESVVTSCVLPIVIVKEIILLGLTNDNAAEFLCQANKGSKKGGGRRSGMGVAGEHVRARK